MKLAAETRLATHILINEEREEWIEDYVKRETSVARMGVQDADSAMMQEQEHMGDVEHGQSTTAKPDKTFEEMMNVRGSPLIAVMIHV